MPAPNRRTLTVVFARSVTSGSPDLMEVSVVPLAEPSAPPLDVVLVGGPVNKTVLLGGETNPVSFQLVPSDHPQLGSRVTYRIGWRLRELGRQTTRDFVMPDADVNFADLDDLGAVLGGETYVQWSDRGVPNGVAALNSLGQVVDSSGTPVASGDGDNLAGSLTASGGIEKVTTPATSTQPASHDFRLVAGVAGRKWTGLVVPASGNFGLVDHGLGTTDVVVAVYRVSDRMPVAVTARPNADGDTVALAFDSPPAQGEYRAVVIG